MVARAAWGAVAMIVWVSAAAAEPKPKPVDIKAIRDKVVVLTDADGGIYVVYNERRQESKVFYGTGKVLHEQILAGPKSWDGDAWSISVAAPRVEYPFMGQLFRKKDGSFSKVCGEKLTVGLTEVAGPKAAAILDKGSFVTTAVIRRPHFLARDDRGIYYYVDVLRDVYGGNGHRMFVGKKGAMKQHPIVDVVSDTGGDVFTTKTGDLRLVYDASTADPGKGKAQWVRGEKRVELTPLDLYMNQPLAYRDLGIYKLAGTICDAL